MKLKSGTMTEFQVDALSSEIERIGRIGRDRIEQTFVTSKSPFGFEVEFMFKVFGSASPFFSSAVVLLPVSISTRTRHKTSRPNNEILLQS